MLCLKFNYKCKLHFFRGSAVMQSTYDAIIVITNIDSIID